jgi:two-component system CheB/CheR fusion protein
MVLTVFTDATAPPEPKAAGKTRRASGRGDTLTAMQRQLQQASEEIRTCREQMQTSQEELKSTNEELQSANEELQSTNEELTTSKEEMQSLNEELQTVNHELQAKVDELSWASNDMKNLLNSTEIATLFLDGGLNVRRFTTQTASIIKLIPGDVGRPITDIVTDLDYPGMAADANEVLRTLVFTEKQIATCDGRWFLVRIMPYRTLENRIDGVVITFLNITTAKTLEIELRKSRSETKKPVTKGTTP